jgi:hypothetical protein
MATDPNPKKNKATPPNSQDLEKTPRIPEAELKDQVFDLSDLEEKQLGELEEPFADEIPLDEVVQPIELPSENVSFDLPASIDDPASHTVGISLDQLPDLANIHESTGLSALTRIADPASVIPEGAPGSSVVIGSSAEKADLASNLEPIGPVAPASGWLESEESLPPPHKDTKATVHSEPLGVHPADLFDAPPPIESSDIFSSGPIPTAIGADQSDVIAATVHAPTTPATADEERPSEIAINFDKGKARDEEGNDDIPVANEVLDSPLDMIDSGDLSDMPPLPGSKSAARREPDYGAAPMISPDASSILSEFSHPGDSDIPGSKSGIRSEPDYGGTPMISPDASSILSELSDPGDLRFDDESSAVRLEAPGVGRTYSSTDEEGTEFDLTISDDPIDPELAEAEAASGNSNGPDWGDQPGSDLFSDPRSHAREESDSGRVLPVDSSLKSDQPSLTSAPSSIFSTDKIPSTTGSKSGINSDSVRIGRRPAEDEESAVEFTDHPTADPESSSAALAGPATPQNLGRRPEGKVDFDPRKRTGAEDSDQDSGRVDWASPNLPDENEVTMGFPQAMLGAPLSGILKRGKFDEIDEESPTLEHKSLEKSKPGKPKGKLSRTKTPTPDGSDPSVELDWMAGSSSEEKPIQPEVYEAKAPEKTKEKKDPSREKKRVAPAREAEKAGGKRGGGGWIGGTLLGMAVASGAFAGLYFGGVIPNAKPAQGGAGNQSNAQNTHNAQGAAKTELSFADARAAIHSGDHAKALTMLEAMKAGGSEKDAVESKAAIGQARFFARLQELGKTNAAVTADDKELRTAREELEAVVNDAEAVKTPERERAAATAAIHLGLSYEKTGDRDKAKKIYEDGKKKFPKFESTFDAALDRLAATAPEAAGGTSRRVTPADIERILFATILLQADAPADEGDEAGHFFWKAVKLAKEGKYGDAATEIEKAKEAHIKRAKAMAGRGLNPLTDPLEQIFPRCCDDLKAYWSALYGNSTVADLVKKEGAEKAMKELAGAQKKALEVVKLMTDLKAAGDKLALADKDLKEAKESFAAKEKEFLANETKAKDDLTAAKENLLKAEAARKMSEETVHSLAKELQSAKLLPEKYEVSALLAAQKTAVDRATGPSLAVLVPPGMMGVAGGPLSAAHLFDLSERISKSDASIKKLTAEKQQISTEYAAEMKKLKDSHAADVKKLTDDFAAEMKKTTDANAADLKKMADKFAIDLKKANDETAAAEKKTAEGFEGKIKALESAVAKEKAATEDLAAKHRIDLKNVVTPAQALDLWLPQLTELRRVADADPALANASKVLAAADKDSEDAAKARTVAGLALLLKGNLPDAKEMFQNVQSSPAYKAAKGKEWAMVAEIGLASVSDPLAPYRLPIEKPRRDLRAAAHFLDKGIIAYKAGRNADAETALVNATKADPTDPLAWYFLGAARWALGSKDQAKEDFRQGGEWEKQTSMSAGTISDNLDPIQGPARDALWVARP